MSRRSDDLIQPFRLETLGVIGRVVRLGDTVDTVLRQHAYPAPVSHMLGETLALAACVAGALKFAGVLTVQTKGDGPLRLMVADYATGGAMRGYAAFDAERVADARAGEPVPRLLGAGVLALTVDQGPDTERYQGIVSLDGGTLADCALSYFRQSDQRHSVVKLAAGRTFDGHWRAGALMLQREPGEGGVGGSGGAPRDDTDEPWRRALTLAGSATTAELLDADLAPDRLLYRLYHEDGVRVFQPSPLDFGCRCSRDRAAAVLVALPAGEVPGLTIDGAIHVTCQFCNRTESFTENAVWAARGGPQRAAMPGS